MVSGKPREVISGQRDHQRCQVLQGNKEIDSAEVTEFAKEVTGGLCKQFTGDSGADNWVVRD